jgi:hypothetical protein
MSVVRGHLVAALVAVIVFLLVLPLFEFYFRFRTPLPRYCPNDLTLQEPFPWPQQ